jgi:hypothetical protein
VFFVGKRESNKKTGKANYLPVPNPGTLFDTTRIHAQAAVEWALK